MREAVEELRRRRVADQPAGARRDGHRPLRDRGRLRLARGVRAQRRDRVRAQPGALPVPALGPGRPTTSRSSRPAPASCTRSTSSTWLAPSSPARSTACCRPTPTPASAPTPTPRWSTASAWSAGASAGSRPRRPCSASRSRCWCRALSASKPVRRPAGGATATDLVLTITEMLRKHGVVGKFVEFYGPGVSAPPWPTAPPSATCRRSSAPRSRCSRSTRRP